ncbi:2-succinyl-6-hydroxy-2,4-cyclohexadiene-1-carboxylate synthase [Halobacillus andaensis]|uniref:2-succinyl-6-hydroxy-2, 4-cyclohexadiene-1-carboxylate synthase n=1 Tax=Halobacillus andaensis TaxID=1176239 RepID=A0A917B8Q3_HALAA|nr:alpha/beta hydrolase [Halobacillus andaensis]MBP2005837.1 pimeloyl-ACP methyl ester carboxylesterase [Halobacillus andaensis]GGF25711.1 2-succinyl-6-hydroxy-2,4-cyclohexadiene-1-carboxylate synthase [Halobacillus andaensis]
MLEYKVYSKVSGKEDLVLLHGMGGNSNIFYKQLKYYREHFNVITIHLPGHGNSPSLNKYEGVFSQELAAQEVIKTLDHLNIQRAHFVGVSLGSIILHHMMKSHPERIASAVLSGAITRFNLFSKFLLFVGRMIKSITPHLWIYYLFAHIIMPRANHKASRDIFIKEARKMKREDFIGWFNSVNKVARSYDLVPKLAKSIPKLYVSGSEDHLFIKNLKKDIKHDINATFKLIEKCGHVCNIERYKEFNQVTLDFLKGNQSVKSTKQIS